jgi:hypothetical protein
MTRDSSDRAADSARDARSAPLDSRDRGQLVLLAAIALVVALVPLVLAYTQLGYHADVRSGTATTPGAEVERTLDRGLQNATEDVAVTYRWTDRETAAATVRNRMEPVLAAVVESRLAEGTAIQVSYNQTRTAAWVQANCPGGPNRQFGSCEAMSGLAVQERANRTHVLGAAFDVQVTTPETDLQFTTVVT